MSDSAGQSTGECSVAIVGVGMAGATTAYYLRQLLPKVKLTLFESRDKVGGRVRTARLDDDYPNVELGASMFIDRNKYMLSFAKQFGLPIVNGSDHDDRCIFFNGQGRQSYSNLGGPSFLAKMRMAWHFGWQLFRTTRYTTALIDKFSSIYDLQDKGEAFKRPVDMLNRMSPEFVDLTRQSYKQWLETKLKVNSTFLNELAFALVNNNYCQDLDVHAFAGFITLAGTTGKLHYIKTGNEKIAVNLVQRALEGQESNNDQTIHATVGSIDSLPNGKHKVTYSLGSDQTKDSRIFDYVVIATPLHQKTSIDVKSNWTLPTSREYQAVDSTKIRLPIKHAYFNLPTNVNIQHSVQVDIFPTRDLYTKSNSDCLFHSAISGPLWDFATTNRSSCVTWAFFSNPQRTPDPVKCLAKAYFDVSSDQELGDKSVTYRWLAYPKYKALTDPENQMGSFVLAPGLFYTNALEQAFSCMEGAAISGRNVALLIANEFKSKTQHESPN